MIGKRVEAFVLATGWEGPLPKAMLEMFFEIDNFMDKMEAQDLDRKVKEARNRG